MKLKQSILQRRVLVLFSILLTLLSINLDYVSGALAEPNLLVKPSFESNIPEPWTWVDPSVCSRLIYENASIAYDGTHYLATHTNNNSDCRSFLQDVSRTINVGETYRGAIWVRSSTGANKEGRLAIWALGGNEETDSISFSSSSTTWKCYETDLTISNTGHSAVRLEIYLDSIDTVDYFFDSATLQLGGSSLCPISDDTTMPTGNITNPQNQQEFGPDDSLIFSANAYDNPGGSGVNKVHFWVSYSAPYIGDWHLAGTDDSYPYQINWSFPENLRSQIMEIAIHVEDNAGNYCIDPSPTGNYTCNDPQSKRTFIYLESKNNEDIQENWIPKDLRFYLNQRSLSDGDQKCGAASGAMMLAMTNKIEGSYTSMSETANEIYDDVIDCGLTASCYVPIFTDRGLDIEEKLYSKNDGWDEIKDEIDNGRPVILLSSKFTKAGHYVIVVGYRQEGNIFPDRELIIYDPFGKWKGHLGVENYDANEIDENSFKGRWVYYDLDEIWHSGFLWDTKRTYLIITKPTQSVQMGSSNEAFSVPSTQPDILSTEPENLVTYEGIAAYLLEIYLPLIVSE